jgi:predicted Holliday junction resolvase-like endonuclease
MSLTETVLIITLIIGIIALLVITTFIRKGIEETTFKKFKDIEHDSSFTDKLNLIKSEIDIANQKIFHERIAERKEYYINDAIRRSGSVSKGKVVEHFAPFLVNDILNPNEIVFMGSPIDLISFTNIDNEKELSIDFLEIKSGNATINKKQKLIRNAINAKRVFYKKVMLK